MGQMNLVTEVDITEGKPLKMLVVRDHDCFVKETYRKGSTPAVTQRS